MLGLGGLPGSAFTRTAEGRTGLLLLSGQCMSYRLLPASLHTGPQLAHEQSKASSTCHPNSPQWQYPIKTNRAGYQGGKLRKTKLHKAEETFPVAPLPCLPFPSSRTSHLGVTASPSPACRGHLDVQSCGPVTYEDMPLFCVPTLAFFPLPPRGPIGGLQTPSWGLRLWSANLLWTCWHSEVQFRPLL